MRGTIILIIASCILLVSISYMRTDQTAETVIDYGDSELFTLVDRIVGIKLILEKAGSWKSIEALHNVRYSGDEASLEEKGHNGYEEIMVFYSDFKTVDWELRQSGFSNNSEYVNWMWVIGKNTDGQWELIDFGY